MMVTSGVFVTCASALVGVHDGIRVTRGVTVIVGGATDGKYVGGGKGLIPLCGLTKIKKNADTTQRIVTSTSIVKTFHTKAEDFFLLGGSCASDIS
jgi:ATP-dependent protease HslVU (ClpYQ) peptidase subunit